MNSTLQISSTIRSALRYLLTAVLALALLWFAFKNVNAAKLLHYAQGIKLQFLPLIVLTGVTSHLLRAKRWVLLLSPLKEQPIKLWNSFCAVIIGYTVNIVLPRGGELARLVAISKEESLPIAGVLPTMLIDRLLDIAMLAVLLGLTLFQLPASILSDFPWLKTGGMVLVVLAVTGLTLLPFAAQILKAVVPASPSATSIITRLHKLAEQFEIGTRSLRNPAVFPAIAILSLVMWFFYWLNLQIMLLAFGLEKSVSAVQSLQVLTLSSFGVLIPTPASVGSYHLLLSKSLMLLCGVDQDLALAFTGVFHLFSFIVVTCLAAAFCLLVSGFYKAGEGGAAQR